MRKRTHLRKILDIVREENISRSNLSREYHTNLELGFERNVYIQQFFFDPGRMKTHHESYTKICQSRSSIFETIVYERQKDEEINKFLKCIEKEYIQVWKNLHGELKRKTPSETNAKKELIKLISKVSSFFGGIIRSGDKERVMERTENKIKEIQKKTGYKNIVHLGQLKGNGTCRHRSILFKIVCDAVGIKCKLVRGRIYTSLKMEETAAHVWNKIQINQDSFVVDCTNFPLPLSENDEICRIFLQEQVREQKAKEEKQYEAFFREHFTPHGRIGNLCKQRISSNNSSNKTTIWVVNVGKDCPLFRSGSKIVVKVSAIRKTGSKEENLELRYAKREASIVKSLDHDNIVGYYCSYIYDEEEEEEESKIIYFCLFLECMKMNGEGFLRILLKEDPHERAIKSLVFLLQSARGLRYLHDSRFLHLDFKPSNVLVSLSDRGNHLSDVKVIDFAGSKMKDVELLEDTVLSTTYGYTAPEYEKFKKDFLSKAKNSSSNLDDDEQQQQQLLKIDSIDEKVDVYSFGKVMERFEEYLKFHNPYNHLLCRCIDEDPKKRPEMSYIIYELKTSLECLDSENYNLEEEEEEEKNNKKIQRLIEKLRKRIDVQDKEIITLRKKNEEQEMKMKIIENDFEERIRNLEGGMKILTGRLGFVSTAKSLPSIPKSKSLKIKKEGKKRSRVKIRKKLLKSKPQQQPKKKNRDSDNFLNNFDLPTRKQFF